MPRDMPEDSSAIVVTALFMEWLMCLRALAGLEPARVPLGLDGQAVRRLISSSVSVSVASLRVMAFRIGVLMYTP